MKQKNEPMELKTIDLRKVGTDIEKKKLFGLIPIMRTKKMLYSSKGRNVKQSEKFFYLFWFIPIYYEVVLIDRS